MDKIDPWQVLWGVTTLILSVVAFVQKLIRDDIKELRADIESRTLVADCDKLHADLAIMCKEKRDEIKRYAHVHGSLGQSGEVINK